MQSSWKSGSQKCKAHGKAVFQNAIVNENLFPKGKVHGKATPKRRSSWKRHSNKVKFTKKTLPKGKVHGKGIPKRCSSWKSHSKKVQFTEQNVFVMLRPDFLMMGLAFLTSPGVQVFPCSGACLNYNCAKAPIEQGQLIIIIRA